MLFPSSILRNVGEDAEFVCEEKGKWSFNGGPLPDNIESFKYGASESKLLTITEVELYNSGVYTCSWSKKGKYYEDSGVLNVTGNS